MDATSTSGRLSLAAAWLIAANVLAGAVADRFGYPGLAATGQVFTDYALPVTLSFSLVHWVTLAPGAALMFLLPLWQAPRVQVARWVLLAAGIVCVVTEFLIGGGSWHQSPLIFAMVDVGIALTIALTFHPPVRLLIGLGVAAVIAAGAGLVFYQPAQTGNTYVVETDEPDNTRLAPEKPAGKLLRVLADQDDDPEVVVLEVIPQVEPGSAPDPVSICGTARGVFEGELRKRRVHPRDARVEFKVHPTFDPRVKYLYPGGMARFRSGQLWECRFQYPDPALEV